MFNAFWLCSAYCIWFKATVVCESTPRRTRDTPRIWAESREAWAKPGGNDRDNNQILWIARKTG